VDVMADDRDARIAQLEAELTSAREEQAALAEILRVIASSPTNLETVLIPLVESAIRLCGAEAGGAQQIRDGQVVPMALAPDWHRLRWEAQQSLGTPPPALSRSTFSGRAMLDRCTINTPDVEAAIETEFPDSRMTCDWQRQRSQVVVPLIGNGEAVGLISLIRFELRPFTDAEVALLETFADQAVIAIENARLFEELEQRNSELSEALEQQTALGDVLRVIASSTEDVQAALESIAETAARLCDAPGGAILQIRDTDGLLATRASFGVVRQRDDARYTDPFREGTGAPITPDSFPGRVLLDGHAIHVDDMEVATRNEFPASRVIQERHGLGSMLGVPLRGINGPIGVLVLSRFGVQPFTARQVTLLEAFADQAVIAIENARLFEELQEANRQLAEASQHKSQFLANMSHELRTPLNAIIGYSEMLQEEAEEADAEAFLPDLQRINAAGKHLLGLINDILDLSKIEAGRMDLFIESFKVGQLVRDVEAIVQPLVEKNGNAFVVDCSADVGTMQADLTKVRQTLFNCSQTRPSSPTTAPSR
jgi:GAF domain-containing protein